VDKRPLLTGVEAAILGLVALTLAGAALIGSGSGDPESRPARTEERSAGRDSRQVDVARIERRVERLRGLRFRRPLKIEFLSPARAQRVFRSRSAAEYPEVRQRVDEEILKLLGLLAPSTDLRRVLAAVANEEVLGFYDDRSKRLVVIRKPTDSRGLLEIVLAHELVHALEDQHFGLKGEPGFTDDESSAASALVEGTATDLMTDYAARYLKPADLLGMLESVTGTETKLPKFIERSLLFPYVEGEKFVTAFREGGSWRAIDKVFELRQPTSTEQILHPEKYAIDERPVRARVGALARQLGDGWARVDASSVGEFDLRLLFRQVGRVKGSAAAAGWGGGRFELWRRRTSGAPQCAAPCVQRDVGVLRLAWDRTGDRREGGSALRHVFERGLGGRRVAARGDVGLWVSRGGAIGMRSQGRTTTVVLAPRPQLAARLLVP
jgi:hypothetical protein